MGGRAGQDFTPGWSMMSEDERRAHHDKMRGLDDYDSCRQAVEAHRGEMARRAGKDAGALPAPRRDACIGLPKAPAAAAPPSAPSSRKAKP